MRAPTVKRGDALTVGLWNSMAQSINEGLNAPRDLDAGTTGDEVALETEREVSRTTEVERVYDPDDEEVYVDVERITTLTVRNSRTGRTIRTYFADS